MTSIAEMGIEYNPETIVAKAGMKIAEKEAKKQVKHLLKDVKKELNKSLIYFGFASFDDVMDKVTEIKDEVMDTFQEASEYGITSVINRPLQIIKRIKDVSNSILHPIGDSKSAKIIDKLQEAGVQSVSVVMPQGAFEDKPATPLVNPVSMSQNLYNPYDQRFVPMRGGKREKNPAEEIEETLNMLINHRIWMLDHAKNINKNSKKRTIKKKKMIKNPKKKGTRKGKGGKRR